MMNGLSRFATLILAALPAMLEMNISRDLLLSNILCSAKRSANFPTAHVKSGIYETAVLVFPARRFLSKRRKFSPIRRFSIVSFSIRVFMQETLR